MDQKTRHRRNGVPRTARASVPSPGGSFKTFQDFEPGSRRSGVGMAGAGRAIAVLLAVAILSGCGTLRALNPIGSSNEEPAPSVPAGVPAGMDAAGRKLVVINPDQLPVRIRADALAVHMFRDIADRAARELADIHNLAGPDRRAIIRLGPFDNNASLKMDPRLFLETVRARAIDHSEGRLLFRDDTVYADILDERGRLSKPATEIHLNGRHGRSRTPDGDLRNDETRLNFRRSVGVDGQLAEASHILAGALYQIRERSVENPGFGTSYFQYHFRLVDQRNGVIIWQAMYDTKVLGKLGALDSVMSSGGGEAPESGFLQKVPF